MSVTVLLFLIYLDTYTGLVSLSLRLCKCHCL